MMKKLLVAVMSFSFAAILAVPASAQVAGGDPSATSDPGVSLSGVGALKKVSLRSENGQINFGGAFTTVLSDTVVLTAPSCVLVEFHAEMCQFGGTENNQSTGYRIFIGGVLGEGHNAGGQIFISPDGNSNGLFDTHGYNSWRCNVPAGTHSILVQGAQAIAGTSCVRARTLATHWKK